MNTVVLEPAARELAEAFSKPPFLYQMDPAAARRVLDEAQSAPIDKPPVDEEWITVPAAVGDVPVRIVKPQGAAGMLCALANSVSVMPDERWLAAVGALAPHLATRVVHARAPPGTPHH